MHTPATMTAAPANDDCYTNHNPSRHSFNNAYADRYNCNYTDGNATHATTRPCYYAGYDCFSHRRASYCDRAASATSEATPRHFQDTCPTSLSHFCGRSHVCHICANVTFRGFSRPSALLERPARGEGIRHVSRDLRHFPRDTRGPTALSQGPTGTYGTLSWVLRHFSSNFVVTFSLHFRYIWATFGLHFGYI